jgi:hypothetical protein
VWRQPPRLSGKAKRAVTKRQIQRSKRKTVKYKISTYKDGFEIAADREALLWLSEICQYLCKLSDEEAETAANHYHLDEYLRNAEPGSIPVVLLYKPHL